LKPFEEMKVVGIKYDLLAPEEVDESPPKKKTAKEPKKGKRETAKKMVIHPPRKAGKPPAKVIQFPEPEKDDEEEDKTISELKGYARQALRALEKNNSVAAYKLLKRIVED
jgi:hypothetical protein